MLATMPRKSKLILPPIDLGKDTVGQRLANFRKESGYTQVELAEKMGIIQGLVSDYERDKLRLHAEMLARFAKALNVSTDEIIGLKEAQKNGKKAGSLRIMRRLNKIEALPSSQQKTLLKTIDMFLKAAGE